VVVTRQERMGDKEQALRTSVGFITFFWPVY
jgi:hypothetical protein